MGKNVSVRMLSSPAPLCPTPCICLLLGNRGDVGFADATATSKSELEQAEAAALEDNRKFSEDLAAFLEEQRSQANGARVCKGGPVCYLAKPCCA